MFLNSPVKVFSAISNSSLTSVGNELYENGIRIATQTDIDFLQQEINNFIPDNPNGWINSDGITSTSQQIPFTDGSPNGMKTDPNLTFGKPQDNPTLTVGGVQMISLNNNMYLRSAGEIFTEMDLKLKSSPDVQRSLQIGTYNNSNFVKTYVDNNTFDFICDNQIGNKTQWTGASEYDFDADIYVNGVDINSQINTNTSNIIALEATTASQQTAIDELGVLVNANTSSINSLGVSVNANTSSINSLGVTVNSQNSTINDLGVAVNSLNSTTISQQSQINTNTSNIATNTSNIATNTSNIATNTSNIATNTSNIATNTSNIATNTSNIATNTSNIATNTADISTNTLAIAGNTSSINTINNKLNSFLYNYYVSAQSGSDLNGDGSVYNNWKTIGKAMTVVNALGVDVNVVINLSAGTYTENVSVTKNGGGVSIVGSSANMPNSTVINGNVTFDVTVSNSLNLVACGMDAVQINGTVEVRNATANSNSTNLSNMLFVPAFGRNALLVSNSGSGIKGDTTIQHSQFYISDTIGLISSGGSINLISCNLNNNPALAAAVQFIKITGFGRINLFGNTLTQDNTSALCFPIVDISNDATVTSSSSIVSNIIKYTSSVVGASKFCINFSNTASSNTYNILNNTLTTYTSVTNGTPLNFVCVQKTGAGALAIIYANNYGRLTNSFFQIASGSYTKTALIVSV